MNGFCRTPITTALILGLILSVMTLANCGGGEDNPVDPGKDPTSGPDTTAPATVADLRLRSPTHNTLALVWTAPGDDGTKGTSTRYDIRFSKASITEANWDQASPIDPRFVPTPKPAGQIETIVVTQLLASQTYYFALKTSDEIPNQSKLSNCCFETTIAENYPPSDIKNLRAEAIDETSFALTWTAPGDDYMTGTAARYDIRHAVRPITTADDWARASVVSDPPIPKSAGENELFVVTDMTARNYFFAIKTVDRLDNWSGLSNQAVGLAYGEVFWAFPSWVYPGGHMYIAYRATASDVTRVSLNDWFYWFEDRACGSKLVMDLVRETMPEGVYVMKFDFTDPQTGRYLPAGSYELFLCYGPDLEIYQSVYFD